MKKEELFKDERWNQYQSVKILKTRVKRTQKDEENAKKFREFIDKKEGTKK